MEFRLLGPVECWVDDEPVPLGRPQARVVLAALLLEAGRVVSRDRLAALLWDGRPPASAYSTVHSHVSRLRTALRGADAERFGVRLVTRGAGYLLDVPDGSLDVARFHDQLSRARSTTDDSARADALRGALDLWRGPALVDVPADAARRRLTAALEELYAQAHEEWAEVELELGRHRRLTAELTTLVDRYPSRERLVGLLMVAQYRSGQQSAALTTYRTTRVRLIEDLGIEPGPELRRLERAVLAQDPALDPPAGAPPLLASVVDPAPWHGPRPVVTGIVGREEELAELSALLDDHRLVTVVGVGGVGKTTVALRVAEIVNRARSDARSRRQADVPPARAITVVSLAAVRDEEDAVLALAAAMGVPGRSIPDVLVTATARMNDRPRLLVLDNCEHVLDVAGFLVRRLLSEGPALRVLATSRQPLEVPDEVVRLLAPLPVPYDVAAGGAAVELFLRRATEANPRFDPDEADLAAAERIARRVDGLPLALELAAGRMRTFSAPELADHLDRNLGLLTTDGQSVDLRHTAVTATLDWSYGLLTPREKNLLTRLSVFDGGFTAAAAGRVCGYGDLSPDSVVVTLSALVDRSLVQADARGTSRFRLLEVVRDDAARRLAPGDRAEVAGRHLGHWLARARDITARPGEEQIAGWLELLPDVDNLRVAADHAFEAGRTGDAVELTVLLFDFWAVRDNRMVEAERWRSRAEPYLADCPPRLRPTALFHHGEYYTGRGDYRQALPLISAAADAAALLDPPDHLQRTEFAITTVRCATRLLRPSALPDARRVFGATSAAEDPYLVMHGVVMLAEALIARGAYAEAADLCRRYADAAGMSAPANVVRYQSMRALAALGAGRLAEADHAVAELERAVEAPGNYLASSFACRVRAVHCLATKPLDQARATLTTLARQADGDHPPASFPGYAVRILLAEAERRRGLLDHARATLAAALGEAARGSDYMISLPGVVGAALLARDLGDDAGRRLATRWGRVRRDLGVPVPQGYEQVAADVLGVDPLPTDVSVGVDPAEATADQAPLALILEAEAWCRSG